MGQIGSTIADAAVMGTRYAKRLTTAIPADRFARLAAPGEKAIQANHPAFILGHLSLYPAKVLELLGKKSAAVTLPENYDALFSKTATCLDDANGSRYPASEQVVEFFQNSYAAAIEAVRQASDEQLLAANPVDSPMKEVLPTLGSVIAFYLNGHVMCHLGQLSTWRRMENLPPA